MQEDMRIPTELIPYCPHCGKPMTMNLRSDDKFVEDEGWLAAEDRYEKFLSENAGKRILFLELGVGYNTPGIIKYPFWRMTQANVHAVYACVNLGQAVCPMEIAERSICINDDIDMVIEQLSCTERGLTGCYWRTCRNTERRRAAAQLLCRNYGGTGIS